jgi:hypothetical protein
MAFLKKFSVKVKNTEKIKKLKNLGSVKDKVKTSI